MRRGSQIFIYTNKILLLLRKQDKNKHNLSFQSEWIKGFVCLYKQYTISPFFYTTKYLLKTIHTGLVSYRYIAGTNKAQQEKINEYSSGRGMRTAIWGYSNLNILREDIIISPFRYTIDIYPFRFKILPPSYQNRQTMPWTSMILNLIKFNSCLFHRPAVEANTLESGVSILIFIRFLHI